MDDSLVDESDVPFTLSCIDCDADSPLCYDEAVAQGWTDIQFTPDGLSENYLGLCPACTAKWNAPGRSEGDDPLQSRRNKPMSVLEMTHAQQCSLPPPAAPPDLPVPCECELPGGEFYCGVPGILALLKDGRVAADFRVERCDLCERYRSDEAARRKLQELGMIAGPVPELPTFSVTCYAIVRVILRDVPARDAKGAALEARELFDWCRHQQQALFDDEFHEFIVEPEGAPPEGMLTRPPQRFSGELVAQATSA